MGMCFGDYEGKKIDIIQKENPNWDIKLIMQGNVEISAALHKTVGQSGLDANNWAFQCEEMASVIRKMNIYKTIREQYGKCYYGVKTALNDAFIIDEKKKKELIAQDINSSEILKPIYEGRDLHKWYNGPLPKYLISSHNGYVGSVSIIF